MPIQHTLRDQTLGLIEYGDHLDHAFQLILLAVNDATPDFLIEEMNKFVGSEDRLLNAGPGIPTEVRVKLIHEIRQIADKIKMVATDSRLDQISAALNCHQKKRLSLIDSNGNIIHQSDPIYVDQETVIEVDTFLTEAGVMQGLEVCTTDDLDDLEELLGPIEDYLSADEIAALERSNPQDD